LSQHPSIKVESSHTEVKGKREIGVDSSCVVVHDRNGHQNQGKEKAVIAGAVIPQAKIKDHGKRDEKKRIENLRTGEPTKVQPGMHQGSHGRILEN